MPPRYCAACGTAESRWTVGGREYTNINPLTGECVDCTAKASRARREREETIERDERAQQLPLGDRE